MTKYLQRDRAQGILAHLSEYGIAQFTESLAGQPRCTKGDNHKNGNRNQHADLAVRSGHI